MSNPRYATLEQLLQSLGFQSQTIPGSHVLYEHPPTEAQFALRLHQPDDLVDPAGLTLVRHTLDAWGILSREDFDEQLRERSLAG